jgi:hypothetical protein
MSSMPLISHRLFVAAIGSEGNTPAKSTQNEAGSTRITGLATAIPMELVEGARDERRRRTSSSQERARP